MGIVLDTSALIDLERRADERKGSLPPEITDVFLPTIVLAELWIGIEVAPRREIRERRSRKIQALVEVTTLIPFSEELAPTYARLHVELSRRGTPIPSNDLAVACTALHYGHDVLVGSSDEAHFRSVPGLVVRVLGAGRAG